MKVIGLCGNCGGDVVEDPLHERYCLKCHLKPKLPVITMQNYRRNMEHTTFSDTQNEEPNYSSDTVLLQEYDR